MEPKDFYKFCPKCGGELKEPELEFAECNKCGFKLFFNVNVGTGVILCNDQNEVLLVLRGHDPGKGQYDLPGGFIQPNETLSESAARETLEELGIQIKDITFFGSYPNSYLYQDLVLPLIDVFFTATIESGELQAGDDVADFKWVAKDKLLEQDIWSPSGRNILRDFVNH
jgi:NAD+ diphosphatase